MIVCEGVCLFESSCLWLLVDDWLSNLLTSLRLVKIRLKLAFISNGDAASRLHNPVVTLQSSAT